MSAMSALVVPPPVPSLTEMRLSFKAPSSASISVDRDQLPARGAGDLTPPGHVGSYPRASITLSPGSISVIALSGASSSGEGSGSGSLIDPKR